MHLLSTMFSVCTVLTCSSVMRKLKLILINTDNNSRFMCNLALTNLKLALSSNYAYAS